MWLSPTRCEFSGDGIDSFLGFEYCDVITLASRVFRILIPIIPSSLRFLRSETLALSRVLHGPLLGLSVASPTLAGGLGWSFVPSFQVYLSEAVGFGGFLGSLLGAPLAVGLLPGSPNRLCPLSAACLLGLEPSPSGVASASLLAPWGCRCACCSLPEAASRREFFPLCLVLPLPGSVTSSRVCSSVGGPVGVAHSFLPSLLLGGSLVRFCGGLC